ncbi:MAG: DUF1015 domain-containing protein [Candidatus Omnitrophica bacterium]|nr:DUF1015 domain-containing protein [Candidatus Omnitrophota bacterium]
MSKIKPFQAVIYNQEKIKDMSQVVCPPYDVISPVEQERYHKISPYNFLHILLGKDIAGEDKYKRSGDYFVSWLRENILIHDQKPAIYFYSQQYKVKGETKTRFGFISLLHLEESKSSLFVHEHTRLEAKEDRFRLMNQVNANLSPIFIVFEDKKRIIQRTLSQHIQGKTPFIEVTDDEKTVHRVWRLDQPETIKGIQDSLEQEDIFIADGHHRYEVACAYRDQMRKMLGEKTNGEESFNYVLTYFTNTDQRGLSIFPIHRLLKLSLNIDMNEFKLKLKEFFDVEEIKDKDRFFFLMHKAGCNEHLIGMYKDKKYFLLRLKNVKILDKMISDKPKEYRALDVAILNYLILKNMLNCDLDNKDLIVFSPHADDFIEQVDKNPAYMAFFLNPVKVEQIIAVARKGERMPPKSTYFYPKVLSGLVINKFDKESA